MDTRPPDGPSPAKRRQIPSAFATILRRLVESTPGVRGAAFADEEGETVDLYGEIDPFELKLAAAHMGILLSRLSKLTSLRAQGRLCEIRLLAKRGQLISRPLSIGYQVTLALEPVACLPKIYRALDQAAAEIRLEAGGVLG